MSESGAPRRDLPAGPEADPEVSVVIPCLNEAEGVGVCVEKAFKAFETMGLAGEVVVVDNGSSDGSGRIAAEKGARVVHERRRGYGNAYLRGFRSARGRYVVMGDADDTYDFLDLPRFVEPLRSGGADMVMGTRLKGEIRPGAMPWTHRWIGNPILSGLLRLMFRTRVSDAHCGMRSFTRAALERMRLRTTGMEFASEIVVNSLRANLRIVEVPITYHPRIGESKLEGLSDAWRHMRFMLLFAPSTLFMLPGLALGALGALAMGATVAGPVTMLGRTWDYHVLLFGAGSLLLGFELVLFDLFAKTYALGAGLIRKQPRLERVLARFTLERGLGVGALLFLAGAALEGKIVLDWYRSGGGELMAVRGVVSGIVAMLVGAQTAFASFLVSLLLLDRR